MKQIESEIEGEEQSVRERHQSEARDTLVVQPSRSHEQVMGGEASPTPSHMEIAREGTRNRERETDREGERERKTL